MKFPKIDPGILSTFRFFAVGRVVILLASWATLRYARDTGPMRFPQIALVEAGVVLVLLFVPGIKKLLGERFLSAALWAAGIGPVLSYAVAVRLRLLLGSERLVISDIWQLILVGLVPLILMSWQFGLRQVIVFTLAVSVIDAMAAVVVARGNAGIILGMLGINFIRLLLFLLVGYVIVCLVTVQREQQRALEAANLSLAQANQRIARLLLTSEQLATSRERNRLAREMHDTLAHTLSALAIQLEAAHSLWEKDQDQVRFLLQQSLETTRLGLNEARLAIRALRAEPLEALGLVLAIRQEAESVSARTGMKLTFHGTDSSVELPSETGQVIYRVACEALANAAQHSGANNLDVSLECKDSLLHLEIRDDGKGFDVTKPPDEDHFGLLGMRERAAIVGAKLDIVSVPGQGTRIILEVKR
mgnify:CR=1 FL=1